MTFGFSPYAGAPFADVGETSQGVVVVLTGVYAVGRLGNVNAAANADANVTGVYAVGRVGTVALSLGCTVDLTGVRTVVRLNRVNIWGLVDTAQTPNWTEVVAA